MLIDSHCHLPPLEYKNVLEKELKEAQEEGVQSLINIGPNLVSGQEVINVANTYEGVHPVVGVYPNDEMDKSLEELKIGLNSLLNKSTKVVAIGECGLDITNWDGQRPVNEQLKLFEMQVEIATQRNLPLVIHNRNGDEYIIEILTKHKKSAGGKLRGVLHCFTSTWEIAQKLIDLDFYISFSGIITYPSGKSIHETVRNIPLDKFLVETDSPYLAPQEHRGQQNHPKYVKIVAQKVAEIKNMPFEDIAKYSTQNASALFGI